MGKYDDIINLDRPVSKNHRQMSIYDRSAQFAPFAALVGYDESISEAARNVDSKIELSVDKIEEISRNLTLLSQADGEKRTANLTYFKKDNKKEGGEYITITATIWKVDVENRLLFLNKKDRIKFSDIIDIIVQ